MVLSQHSSSPVGLSMAFPSALPLTNLFPSLPFFFLLVFSPPPLLFVLIFFVFVFLLLSLARSLVVKRISFGFPPAGNRGTEALDLLSRRCLGTCLDVHTLFALWLSH